MGHTQRACFPTNSFSFLIIKMLKCSHLHKEIACEGTHSLRKPPSESVSMLEGATCLPFLGRKKWGLSGPFLPMHQESADGCDLDLMPSETSKNNVQLLLTTRKEYPVVLWTSVILRQRKEYLLKHRDSSGKLPPTLITFPAPNQHYTWCIFSFKKGKKCWGKTWKRIRVRLLCPTLLLHHQDINSCCELHCNLVTIPGWMSAFIYPWASENWGLRALSSRIWSQTQVLYLQCLLFSLLTDSLTVLVH